MKIHHLPHIKNISIIEPCDKKLPLEDVSPRLKMPTYGLLSIADALKMEGYNVTVYCELVGTVDWPTVLSSDVVCFSLLSVSSHKGYQYAEKIRAADPNKLIIFGGSHPSMLPKECSNYCDYVIKNEGEHTIIELLDAIKAGREIKDIPGIAYLDDEGNYKQNVDRNFISELPYTANPALIHGSGATNFRTYISDIFTKGLPRNNIIISQASRGCPFPCTFCFVKQELGRKFRRRSPQDVLREIEMGIEYLQTKHVFFVDNEFAANRDHALEIIKLIEKRFKGNISVFLFTRSATAHDQELMKAMERAGKFNLGIGVESAEPSTLEVYQKKQTLTQVHESLELFRKYNVDLSLQFVLGADTDSLTSIDYAVDIGIKYKAARIELNFIYDFPGREKISSLAQCVPDKRFIHKDWRFFSSNYAIHYPKRMRPSELTEKIMSGYERFWKESNHSIYRYNPYQTLSTKYLSMLKKAEEGLYDDKGMLCEDRLPGPFHDIKKLDISPSHTAILKEMGRFYLANVTNPSSWKRLLKFAKIKSTG